MQGLRSLPSKYTPCNLVIGSFELRSQRIVGGLEFKLWAYDVRVVDAFKFSGYRVDGFTFSHIHEGCHTCLHFVWKHFERELGDNMIVESDAVVEGDYSMRASSEGHHSGGLKAKVSQEEGEEEGIRTNQIWGGDVALRCNGRKC
jgi:hypothetical protein